MSIRYFVYGFVLWWMGTGGVLAASEWEEVKIGQRGYVTLESFAKFYRLKIPTETDAGFLELRGTNLLVRVKPENREAYVNGFKVWLSFPLAVDDRQRILIPKADVILLFDPLIRQGRAVPARVFKGVVLDPGHGGADQGAQTRGGYTEKRATLDTAMRLEALLKAKGIPVILTRRTDVFVTLEDRAAVASRLPGYVFVSIHYNAGPRATHGVETFALSPQGTPSTSSEGRMRASDLDSQRGNRTNLHNILLTGLVHREVAKLHSPAGDRGIKRARFVVLRESFIPSVLVEGGFMSNGVDADLIVSGAYREKMAQAILRGILAYAQEVDPTNPWVQRDAPPENAKPLLKPAPKATPAPVLPPETVPPAVVKPAPVVDPVAPPAPASPTGESPGEPQAAPAPPVPAPPAPAPPSESDKSGQPEEPSSPTEPVPPPAPAPPSPAPEEPPAPEAPAPPAPEKPAAPSDPPRPPTPPPTPTS